MNNEVKDNTLYTQTQAKLDKVHLHLFTFLSSHNYQMPYLEFFSYIFNYFIESFWHYIAELHDYVSKNIPI